MAETPGTACFQAWIPAIINWRALVDCVLQRPASSVGVRAGVSLKEISGLSGLSTKRSLYSSGRSISGVKAGLDCLFPGGPRTTFLRRTSPNVSTVRCEATVAEKEAAPVEKFEYQAEVRLCHLLAPSPTQLAVVLRKRALRNCFEFGWEQCQTPVSELFVNCPDASQEMRWMVLGFSFLGEGGSFEFSLVSCFFHLVCSDCGLPREWDALVAYTVLKSSFR